MAALLPRQVARCLAYVSRHPGSSGTVIQIGLGMRHLSQASRLLIRLEAQGLIFTDRSRRGLNAWQLTEQGQAVAEQLPEGVYE